MIDRLPFATPLVYSTQGQSAESIHSRELRDRIKRGDRKLLRQIGAHVAQLVVEGKFPNFFGSDITLVPVPGHAPLAPGAISTPQRIAMALHENGLGAEVVPLLERRQRVQKSAFAAPHERPRARDHYESLAISPSLLRPRKVLLIDDFVTRGATLLGAAARIHTVLPDVEIRGFALVRSITDGDIFSIRDPRDGILELMADAESRRRP